MSSLLAGPSRITPWIEDTVFRALLHGPAPEPQRPRLAQVLAMRRYGPGTPSNDLCTQCPSFLVVHDGKTSVICFLSKPLSPSEHGGLPTKGCIVRISDWSVSLVEHCAGHHVEHLLARPDSASVYLEMKPRVCLDVSSVETLGAHGMGVVGNPFHVHQSVEVRRALLSLDSKKRSLAEQLKLVAPLGNVEELFSTDGPSTVIESLIALTHNERKLAASKKRPSGVVFGNVEELLEASRNGLGNENPFSGLIALATRPLPPRPTEKPSTRAAPRNGITTSQSCVLGDVEALLSGKHQLGTESLTVDAVLALARQMDVTPPEAQGDTVEPYEITDVIAGKSPVSLPEIESFMSDASERAEQPDETGAEGLPSEEDQKGAMIQPYESSDNVARQDSTVSLSGMQSALKSLLGRKSSTSEPVLGTHGTELGSPLENVVLESTGVVPHEDETDNDSDIAGISDMLISQTQDEDTSESMRSKKRSLEETSGGGPAGTVDVDGAPAAKQENPTAKKAKRRPKSLLQDVMRQARKGSAKIALQEQAASGPPVTKKRRNGLLSSWLAQRVRPQG